MRNPSMKASRVLVRALIVVVLMVMTSTALARPSIGLALSGGGARGAAHVGVLRVIEELGIPIDYVAGTSMGSIIGGLYAMGLSPDEIEATIKDIDWNAIFDDNPVRPERRMQRKLDDRQMLIGTRPGVIESERRVDLVPALMQGQRLALALRQYTLPARSIDDFDQLPIPFRAVATDVITGEAVVLKTGDLATAIRASMAVPAVFSPVEIDDRLLVDGGLAMNLPISVVREMGADIIIAVDIGGPRRERDEIANLLQMLDQIAGLVTWRNTQEEIATLTARDLLLVPPLGRTVMPGDFNNMLTAIQIGEDYTREPEQRTRLAALAVPAAQYAAWQARRSPLAATKPVIDRVRIDNRSRLDDRLLSSRLEVPVGEPLNPQALERQLEQIHGLDNFEAVTYRVDEVDGQTELVVTAKPKSWGTSWLQGGLELSSTGGGDSNFNIGLGYTMLPVNRLNAEWRTQFQLGQEPALSTVLYQPLDIDERWFAEAELSYLSQNLVLFDPTTHNLRVAEYQLERSGGRLAIGYNFEHWGRLSLSYGRFAGTGELNIGDPSRAGENLPRRGFDFDSGYLDLALAVDTMDSPNFPRQGLMVDVLSRTSRTALGASDDFDLAGLSVLRARSHGRNTYIGGLTLAGHFGGDTPPQSFQRLGGFLNLSGFNQRELSGVNMGLARGIYMRDLDTPLVKTYAGASLETGNTWMQRSDIQLDNLRVAGSLFIGADTLIGPLYLGYGRADAGETAFYLFLGRPWHSQLTNF